MRTTTLTSLRPHSSLSLPACGAPTFFSNCQRSFGLQRFVQLKDGVLWGPHPPSQIPREKKTLELNPIQIPRATVQEDATVQL